MSLREKIADEVERYAWWFDGDIIDGYPLDEVVTAILAAIAVERPAGFVSLVEAYEDGFEAGRMTERERLAKLAEDDLLEADLGMDSTMRQVRLPVAEWIRSQKTGTG